MRTGDRRNHSTINQSYEESEKIRQNTKEDFMLVRTVRCSIRGEKPKTARDRKFATGTWPFDGRWVINKIVLRSWPRSSEDDSLSGPRLMLFFIFIMSGSCSATMHAIIVGMTS